VQQDITSNVVGFITAHPGVNLTASNFPAMANITFAKTGLSLDNYIETINEGITWALQKNNSVIAINNYLQSELDLINDLLIVWSSFYLY
jgi:hypothetical protein